MNDEKRPMSETGIYLRSPVGREKEFETMQFDAFAQTGTETEQVLSKVLEAMSEKKYNPVNQLVGFIISGDPTYITSHNGARSLIMKVDRDTLLEEIVQFYLENNAKINWERQ